MGGGGSDYQPVTYGSGQQNIAYPTNPGQNELQNPTMFTPSLGNTGQGGIGFGFSSLGPGFPDYAIPQGITNLENLYGSLGSQAGNAYQKAQFATNNGLNQGLTGLQNTYGTGIGNQQQLTGQTLPQIGNLYGNALQQQGNVSSNAMSQVPNIYGNSINSQGAIAGNAQGQIAGLESQNQGQVNNLLNDYTKNYVSRLGPQGDLGQQLAGEYNNYGITPSSGAFQQGLGNTLGALGAQNELTLGQQALQPGINAQYNTLSQGLGSQLGTAQQQAGTQSGLLSQGLQSQLNSLLQGAGAQSGALSQGLGSELGTAQQGTGQAGKLQDAATLQNMQFGQQGALAPLNYANMALPQESSLINQGTQLPIQYWAAQNDANLASQIGLNNFNAQGNAADAGKNGQTASAGFSALGALGAGAFM